MDLKETYNKIARDWHKQHSRDEWWVAGTDKFLSLMPAGSTILDAGCGTGVKSKYLLEHGYKVVGIDLSDEMIKIAEETAPQGEFYPYSFAEAQKLERTFDGIFMQASLLHVPKAEAGQVIKNLATLLRPGGYFYIAVKEKRENGLEEENKTENDVGYEYTRFFSYYTLDEIQDMLTNAMAEIVYKDVAPSGHTRWVQVIGKKS